MTVYGSFLYRPPETGLAAMPPLSDEVFSNTAGADAWIVDRTGAARLRLLCGQPRGHAPHDAGARYGLAALPPFSWAAALSGYLLLAICPVMIAAMTMLFIDRHFGGVFFDSAEGGAPLLYQHLAWFFFTGAYVLVVMIAAGVISEVLPTFARKPLFSHRGAMLSLLAIAVLGPLAWMQNMYTAPIPVGFEIFAMLFALALAVPIGLLIFNWVATLWEGTLHTRAAPLFALGAISSMSIGLAGELAYSVLPVGWQLNNTTAAQGDTFAVLTGGAVLGGFAALHYWFPKLSGRIMSEGLGKAALAAILAGTYVYVLAMFFAGLKAQPVDVYTFFEDNGLDGFNLVASIAAFVLVAGILLELGNAVYSYRNGVRAGHDPWGGGTLEWFALSPPPDHNFDAVPDVRSAEPLHDIRRTVRERTEAWSPPPPSRPTEAAATEAGSSTRDASEDRSVA